MPKHTSTKDMIPSLSLAQINQITGRAFTEESLKKALDDKKSAEYAAVMGALILVLGKERGLTQIQTATQIISDNKTSVTHNVDAMIENHKLDNIQKPITQQAKNQPNIDKEIRLLTEQLAQVTQNLQQNQQMLQAAIQQASQQIDAAKQLVSQINNQQQTPGNTPAPAPKPSLDFGTIYNEVQNKYMQNNKNIKTLLSCDFTFFEQIDQHTQRNQLLTKMISLLESNASLNDFVKDNMQLTQTRNQFLYRLENMRGHQPQKSNTVAPNSEMGKYLENDNYNENSKFFPNN